MAASRASDTPIDQQGGEERALTACHVQHQHLIHVHHFLVDLDELLLQPLPLAAQPDFVVCLAHVMGKVSNRRTRVEQGKIEVVAHARCLHE
eukprot:752594-Hanusia_phi.AAC.4